MSFNKKSNGITFLLFYNDSLSRLLVNELTYEQINLITQKGKQFLL